MRKIIAVELVSVDGIMEKPEEWAGPYSNDESNEADAVGMAASDALLLGRATYGALAAFWPHQPSGDPMVDYINGVRKYVVSRTLERPLEWNNSTLIEGNVVEEITRLKRQSGKDITILGSGELMEWLIKVGLLDELRLKVHPLVLGRGKRLFESETGVSELELMDSRAFGTGVVSLVYRPVANEAA